MKIFVGEEYNMTCTRCAWHKNEFNVNCTGFFGNPNADIVFLGEAFGINEAKAGKAFVGDAGDKLNELLEFANLKREDIAIMNAMRCYQFGNPTPSKKELDLCAPFSYRDILKIKPKLIVALGASATYTLLKKTEVTPYLGRLMYSEVVDCNVFVVYHPASCLYDIKKWDILVKQFKRIPNLLDKKADETKHYNYKIIDSDEEFNKVYNELIDKPLYFDIETEGLNEYDFDLEIKTLQMSTSEELIYVVLKDTIYSNKDKLKELFDRCPVIGQDFAFDAKWLFVRLGVFPKKWLHDSCLAEFMISGFKNNDLDYTTGKYNPDYYGYWDDVKAVGGAHLMKDNDKLYQYGADDVGTMVPIRRKQFKIMTQNKKMEWSYNNITMPCNKVLTKMSLRGLLYDVDKLLEVDKQYAKRGMQLLAKASEDEGIDATERHFNKKFNPRSSDMIKWLLLDYYSLPVLTKTKHDNPSIGKDEMKIYASKKYKNNYCKIMEKYRSIQNIRDNFLGGVIPKLVNGVAHTKYSLHAAASGRPNSRDPNILNIPRDDKDIKKCIIARPNHIFVYADLSQIEVRIAAVVYNDKNLINLCNTEGVGDFHSIIAAKVNKVDLEEFIERKKAGDKRILDMRQRAKTITFGILYQQSAQSLAVELKISVRKAYRFIDEYFEGFPDLKKNIEKTKEFVIENGYVDTFFGFRRYFKYHTEEDTSTLREAVNHCVQGTAWQLMQLILINVDNKLEKLKSDLVMQVYDSLTAEAVEGSEDETEEVKYIIKNTMEHTHERFDGLNRVKVKTDLEVGHNLADMKGV